MWPFNLSVRLPIVALVGRYPANWLIGREPIFQRIAPLIPESCGPGMLCGISVRFQTLSPSERQVAHVLLTRPPLSLHSSIRKLQNVSSVRLACVRRAASVRPEPGSNSLIMVLKTLASFQSLIKDDPASFPLLVSLYVRLSTDALNFVSRVLSFPFRTSSSPSSFTSVLSFSLFIFQGAVRCRLIGVCVVRTRQLLYNTTHIIFCQHFFQTFFRKISSA